METASGSPSEMTKAKERLGFAIQFFAILSACCFGGLVGNLTGSILNFILASLGMISLLEFLTLLVVYFWSLIDTK